MPSTLNPLEYDKIGYTRFNIKRKGKSAKYFENYHIFLKGQITNIYDKLERAVYLA